MNASLKNVKSFTVAFVVCMIAFSGAKLLGPEKLTEDRFSRIETGMSYSEVVQIIGRPTDSMWRESFQDSDFLFCVWSPKTVNANITFCDGAVYHKAW